METVEEKLKNGVLRSEQDRIYAATGILNLVLQRLYEEADRNRVLRMNEDSTFLNEFALHVQWLRKLLPDCCDGDYLFAPEEPADTDETIA